MSILQEKTWNSVAHEISFNLEIDDQEIEKNINTNCSVLDYGCGYGRNSQILNTLGYKNIIGVDTSSEMIKRGKKDYPHLKLKHYQNIELPYPDESFDLIIICAVLTCIPNNKIKLSVLSEIHRLLRKEGVLHMVEFSNHKGKSFSSSFGIQMEHQKPNELRKLAHLISLETKFEIKSTDTLTGRAAQSINYIGRKKEGTLPFEGVS